MNKNLLRTELAPSSQQFLEAGTSGVLTMPADVSAAFAAFGRAGKALHDHIEVDLQAARGRYAADVAEALRRDVALPAAKAVEQVAAQARSHAETKSALQAAEQLLLSELRAAIPPPDVIVTEHLRPALLAAYDEARQLLRVHGPVLGEPADLAIVKTPAVAAAWVEFGTLVTRTGALRKLHQMTTDPAVSVDNVGAFATHTEAPTDERLWGGQAVALHNQWRPWPADPRAFLAWLLASGLTIWVPTAAERDAAAHEYASPPRSSRAVMVGA